MALDINKAKTEAAKIAKERAEAKKKAEATKQKAIKQREEIIAKQKAAKRKHAAQKSQKTSSVSYQQAQAGQFAKGAAKAASAAGIITEHTVVKGDTLSQIAKKYYGSGSKPYWELIQKANSSLIKDANLIYPGQVFKIPTLPEDMKK
jgi:nucleoid-associated protein YgaU